VFDGVMNELVDYCFSRIRLLTEAVSLKLLVDRAIVQRLVDFISMVKNSPLLYDSALGLVRKTGRKRPLVRTRHR
jgi:hypothetical protein